MANKELVEKIDDLLSDAVGLMDGSGVRSLFSLFDMYNNDHSVKRYVTEKDDVLSRSNLTSVTCKARLDKDQLCTVSVLTFEGATRIKN